MEISQRRLEKYRHQTSEITFDLNDRIEPNFLIDAIKNTIKSNVTD